MKVGIVNPYLKTMIVKNKARFLNALLLTAVLAQATAPPSIAQTMPIANSLISRTSQANLPICFIQTSDGKVRDLSSMCGYQYPDVCNLPISLDPEKTALLADFCHKNQRCTETNTCDRIPSYISNE
jgi:hypothetical protein